MKLFMTQVMILTLAIKIYLNFFYYPGFKFVTCMHKRNKSYNSRKQFEISYLFDTNNLPTCLNIMVKSFNEIFRSTIYL